MRAGALASTQICTTGAGTAISSREMRSARALVIAALYSIGVSKGQSDGFQQDTKLFENEEYDSRCGARQEVGNQEAVVKIIEGSVNKSNINVLRD